MNTFSSPHNIVRDYSDITHQSPLHSQHHQSPDHQHSIFRQQQQQHPHQQQQPDYVIQGPLMSQITNLNIQQALIIRELIFTLLGHEGHYIQFTRTYDYNSVHSRIEGPDFKIAKNLDISLKNITKKLVKFGKYYSGLRSFIQVYDNKKYGCVVQKFCYEVSEFLSKYQAVMINVEHEFKFNRNFNLNMLDQLLHQEISNELTHLYQIALEINRITEERSKITQMEILVDFRNAPVPNATAAAAAAAEANTSVNGEKEANSSYAKSDCCKGGLLLQIIQERMIYYKGDPTSLNFLTNLFNIVSSDYTAMLNQWLREGSVDDPYDEFMIKEKKVPSQYRKAFQNRSQYYWSDLFLIKTDGLLNQFKNPSIQSKILNTGKYLTIFKRCTGLTTFDTLKEQLTTISNLNASDLELKIDQFHQRANKMLLKLLFEGYHLPEVVNIFQKLFLFSESKSIDDFVTTSFNDLKRNKSRTSVSRLQKQYDDIFKFKIENKVGIHPSIYDVLLENQKFSIGSESFYSSVEELLERDQQNSAGFDGNYQDRFGVPPMLDDDSGVSGVSVDSTNETAKHEPTISCAKLSVSLPFPLNLIFNQQLLCKYQIMFQLIINVKLVAKFNSINWQEINYSHIWTHPRYDPRVKKFILRCRVLHSRVCSFITLFESYVVYDVVNHNFEKIQKILSQTANILSASEVGSNITNEADQIFNGTLLGGANFNTNNNNSIFDSKIRARSRGNETEELVTVEQLMEHLSKYSSSLMYGSLIRREDSFDQLRKVLEFIFQFNNYIIQVKRLLVLLDPELYDEYSKEFPKKFNKPMDPQSIEKRFQRLSDSFLAQYEKFGETILSFLDTMKKIGQKQNQALLELSDRLDMCFPG
ncbi:SPC97 Spindle pole body component SPC97 [Candida maltosa Xu316]